MHDFGERVRYAMNVVNVLVTALLLGASNGIVAASAFAPGKEAINPWAGRSGQAEALADITNQRPIKLLYQVISGERDEIHTPGLSNCNPDRFDVPKDARPKFEPLGADYYESIRYTSEELARLRSATLFARAYNVTIFTVRRDEVLRICPAATRD